LKIAFVVHAPVVLLNINVAARMYLTCSRLNAFIVNYPTAEIGRTAS